MIKNEIRFLIETVYFHCEFASLLLQSCTWLPGSVTAVDSEGGGKITEVFNLRIIVLQMNAIGLEKGKGSSGYSTRLSSPETTFYSGL